MPRSPRVFYAMVLAILIVTLTGCELRRDTSEGTDAQPVGDLSPTLAPLGANSSELTNAAPPTVIVVDPTATASTLEAGAAVSDSKPTDQPAVDLSSGANAEQTATQPESFVLPEDQPAVVAQEGNTDQSNSQQLVVEEAALEAPVITNAVPEESLPSGGPIAANPPVSATIGDYADTVPSSGSHTVQLGDTLFSISQRYGTTVEAIMLANGLTSETIYEGQVLNLAGGYDSGYAGGPSAYAPTGPGVESAHIVAEGETLFSIAQRYGTSVEVIAAANNIPYPYIIYAGQPLNISGYPGGYAPDSNAYYPPEAGYSPYNNAYPSPNAYTQPNAYAQPDAYSQPDAYGQPNAYAQPNTYGQPNPYYQPETFAPPGNALTNPNGLASHTVAPGETLFSIAQRYGVTAESIAAANGIINPNQIAAGQVLYLP